MSKTHQSRTLAHPQRYRWGRRFIVIGLVGLLLAAGVEGFARYGLGLGDPPLSKADPQIEYLFKPSRTYQRFGNRMTYNRYSMRANDFPAHRTTPDEARVLFIGDSVINGGALIDQSELATEILRLRLTAALDRPVVVGNASAGSWGPPNMLAYVQRFGFFDADVLVIVLSSHDYADVPTFEPIVGVDLNFPDHSPSLASVELFTRYLPRYLPFRRNDRPQADADATTDSADIAQSMESLAQLIALAREVDVEVWLVQHLERGELREGPRPGHDVIRQWAERLNVPTIALGPVFEKAQAAGDSPYRDNIHPNAFGQQLIADTLFPLLHGRLESTSTIAPAKDAGNEG